MYISIVLFRIMGIEIWVLFRIIYYKTYPVTQVILLIKTSILNANFRVLINFYLTPWYINNYIDI